jgi:hypothetical protein
LDAKNIMSHRIAIIKFKDERGSIRYRAYSHPNPDATNEEICQRLFYAIGYQQEYPLDNTIFEGKLHETFLRLCSLSIEERQQGVQIYLKANGSIIKSYSIGSGASMPQEADTALHVSHNLL